ncbi:hypothetical protein [Yersinia ruckeri]|uniref:hypothetical protein n=1 Tax=Yersinia ruckeri TaxID=29486 RepID=UPI00223714DD|nr:hypothetical protein [Yersinia ruckeri]MCW6598793.1 hypothetical protein [Yersinia ruckeri]
MASTKPLNVRIQDNSSKMHKLEEQLKELREKSKELRFELFQTVNEKLTAEKPETVYVSALFNGWSYAGKIVEINRRVAKIQWVNGEVSPVNLDAIQLILTDKQYAKHEELEGNRDAISAEIDNIQEDEPKAQALKTVKELAYITADQL